MANQMLVDATHPEETRVVVVRGNRVEEFDFESANRKQLRGNIYLAKVTRVEPSLQAAFVDYGGNRHGFLAFSEIHPDYYQIPVADRQALLEEEKGHDTDNDADEQAPAEADASDNAYANSEEKQDDVATQAADATSNEEVSEPVDAANPKQEAEASDDDSDGEDDNVEQVGAEDAMEEVPERRSRRRAKQYKIQEVIKRRQILLVQVVKEERGNKGAALTTYLSLAGRYSVLMPNTARGGGISRKITNVTDRKRLKQIAADLEVADGMGVILRTAGASRTKTEIKRDFEYLLRLWENVRDLTLQSAAPLLVYEEGSLIKRSIRDLYNKDIDQVLVSGDEGYKEAKGFMRMLMPSHARNVQPYREVQPVFTRFGIESQLDAMFSPQVTLKSGGYIVIDQTEALVSIDVNSGRSTREHNIEDTALSTNLEAAEEISRQLRLRDLAGLVVIDFIDMEEKRNNRAVEKRLKDCLKSDRARIQVGRISHFGLMEMSRQRIRTGVLESTMDPCPHCHGTGHVRAAASVALLVLRTIEDHLLKGATHHMVVKTRTNVALYILNQKRQNLFDLENRFGVHVAVEVDDTLEGKHLEIERGDPLDKPVSATPTVSMLTHDELIDDIDEERDEDERPQDEESSSKKRRRRRRRKKSSSQEARNTEAETESASDEDANESGEDSEASEARSDDETEERPRRSRRRGRRGGRRNRRNRGEQDENGGTEADTQSEETVNADASTSEAAGNEGTDAVVNEQDSPTVAVVVEPTGVSDAQSDEKPASSDASPASTDNEASTDTAVVQEMTEVTETAQASAESTETETESVSSEPETTAPQAEPASPEQATPSDEAAPTAEAKAEETAAPQPAEQKKEEDPARPKRTGWWNRSGFL